MTLPETIRYDGQKTLDRMICPRCESQQLKILKSWEIKGRVQAKGKTRGIYVKGKYNITKITMYQCQMCHKKFRRGERMP